MKKPKKNSTLTERICSFFGIETEESDVDETLVREWEVLNQTVPAPRHKSVDGYGKDKAIAVIRNNQHSTYEEEVNLYSQLSELGLVNDLYAKDPHQKRFVMDRLGIDSFTESSKFYKILSSRSKDTEITHDEFKQAYDSMEYPSLVSDFVKNKILEELSSSSKINVKQLNMIINDHIMDAYSDAEKQEVVESVDYLKKLFTLFAEGRYTNGENLGFGWKFHDKGDRLAKQLRIFDLEEMTVPEKQEVSVDYRFFNPIYETYKVLLPEYKEDFEDSINTLPDEDMTQLIPDRGNVKFKDADDRRKTLNASINLQIGGIRRGPNINLYNVIKNSYGKSAADKVAGLIISSGKQLENEKKNETDFFQSTDPVEYLDCMFDNIYSILENSDQDYSN